MPSIENWPNAAALGGSEQLLALTKQLEYILGFATWVSDQYRLYLLVQIKSKEREIP